MSREGKKKKLTGSPKVKISTWKFRDVLFRKALPAGSSLTRSPSPSRLMRTYTRVCLIAVSPSFFFKSFFFFTTSLCSDRNKPQRRYYYSLDHNDKTWTSEAWAQNRLWPDDNGHSNLFLFRLYNLPPPPHWRRLSDNNRRPPALRHLSTPKRREATRSISDNRIFSFFERMERRKRKISWNVRAYARVLSDARPDRPGMNR